MFISGMRSQFRVFARKSCVVLGMIALFAAIPIECAVAAYVGTWQQLATSSEPTWRGWSVMTWVSNQNRIVLWGGSGGSYVNDIHALDPTAQSWSVIQPDTPCVGNTSLDAPNGTDESGVVFDPINNSLWVASGGSGYRCGTPNLVGRTAAAGTGGANVVDPTLSGTTTDLYKDWIVRVGSSEVLVVAYNPLTKALTLASNVNLSPGGAFDLYADFGGGTWAYSFAAGTYSKLAAVHWGYSGFQMSTRRSPGFATDGSRAFLIGGADWDGNTYMLDFATKSWSIALAGSGATPSPRRQVENQFVYDSVNNKFILFGGYCSDPTRCTYGNALNDTWKYDQQANAWSQVTSTVTPPERGQAQMYFDTAKQVVVLFGGYATNQGGTPLNDLWLFDVNTQQWSQLPVPSGGPGGVGLGQVAYAPTTGCGYLFGGLTATGPALGTWKL